MKFRMGFVSNSSSTSFLIEGRSVEEIYKIINDFLLSYNADGETLTIEKTCKLILHTDGDVLRKEYHDMINWDPDKEEKEKSLLDWKKQFNRENIKIPAIEVASMKGNSIPCELQEKIEEIGERYHWG